MRKRNDSVISKPFAVFVVIGIGVALTAYVVIGIVSIEIKASRMNQEKRVVSNSNESVRVEGWLQDSKNRELEAEAEIKKGNTIESVEGEVLSFENGIVTIEADLGNGEQAEVRLFVNKEDEKLLDVGANVAASLSDEVLVSDIEDGAVGAEKFMLVEVEEEESE